MSKQKIKLTIAQHNKLFKYRQVKLLTYYEIIDDPQNKEVEMYQYIRLPVRIVCFLLSPLAILVGGVPAMIGVIKDCIKKHEVGADTINREWLYEQLRGES